MKDNKQQAFMKAYQACHEAFVRYCSALAYGKMDTEDLVQDVLLSAYHHFDGVERKDQFLHYLIRAARNRSLNLRRKKRYKTEILDKHAERIRSHGVSPELALDIEVLYRTLDLLPDKQRDALVLYEVSGFSMKEIADIQNSTEGAVKTKISRGRKRLRKLLQDQSVPRSVSSLLATAQMILL
ncbi:MAG: RNA polymerase sigma factor [Bacteroidota bacterium]